MQGKFWLNGQLTESISANSRGLHYGDGHFTTMAVQHGQCLLWSAHLARLKYACQRLYICEPDWQAVEQLCTEVARQLIKGVLKLTVVRSCGGRGYSPTGCNGSDWLLSASAWPERISGWQSDGINVGLCQQTLGQNPLLAGIKHLNRLEQVLLRREVDMAGWDEGIACDLDGYVIEACSGNLLWYRAGHWFTPELTHSGVRGVMLQHIENILAMQGTPLITTRSKPAQLLEAEAIALANSLWGVVPVVELAGHAYDPSLVHQLAAKMRESFVA